MGGVCQFILTLLFLIPLSTFCTIIAAVHMFFTWVLHPFSYARRIPRPTAPECLTHNWNHCYITLQDRNIRLHYVEAGAASKPLMLFVHGFPEFWYTWRNQLKDFSDTYRTVAIDMRGYGNSEKPRGIGHYVMRELVADVVAFVKALGYEKCILVAHDWGGIVAWQTAVLHPEIVEKLVIMNSPYPPATDKLSLLAKLRQFRKSWYVFFFQCPGLPELYYRCLDFRKFDEYFRTGKLSCRNKTAFSEEDIEAWKFVFSQSGAFTPPLNYYRAAFQRPRDKPPLCDTVQPPTLIIWGTADFALEPSLATLSRDFCANGMLKLVDGASHWVQHDQPQLCHQYIREFLHESMENLRDKQHIACV